MKKIFNETESANKKFDRGIYSEEYVVKYWILLDEDGQDSYWHPMEETYYAASKNAHKSVINKWIKDHKKHSVKLISVIYQ
jgi:hypothetical protein